MPSPYRMLATVISINAVVMFFITYVMIDTIGHFHFNINRVYMALLMVAPMVLLMVGVMRSMYENRRLNIGIYLVFGSMIVVIFALIRTQTPVGDHQFLRSMIPHHSGAIVMCERASITDVQIQQLCGEIVKAQKEEIAEMERILTRLASESNE